MLVALASYLVGYAIFEARLRVARVNGQMELF